MSNLLERLNFEVILADGAMGTMLHSRGVSFDKCFDELNLTNPAAVADVHREYIEAGAQLVLTNTFGANRFKLGKHGLDKKVTDINKAGVELAKRSVAASFKNVLIAGDIGPLGVRIAPFGRVQPEAAREAFAEQIRALCEAGADLIVIETMTDLHEIREAIKAAKQTCKLPVVASVTFTRDDCTVLGDDPMKVARTLHDAGADILGVNCSGGPAQLLRILKQMRHAAPDGKFWVKPNAGWPEQVGGRIMYPADPDYFGDYALSFREAGACIVGGCCGTTPQHIAAMRKALDTAPEINPMHITMLPAEEIVETAQEQPTQFAQKLAAGKFAVSVEMDPPRGLSTHKLLAGASLLTEAGADVINVADSPMARMRMSAWAVCDVVQRKVNVETTLHFPTRGRNLLRVQGDLLAAHALGIRNVFVVMGDPTAIGDYPEATDNYDLVPSGLIKLIKQGFNAGVDHSGTSIGQPTSFFVGAALNLCPPDADHEMKNLQRKVKAGTDFFITQPIYQAKDGEGFLAKNELKHGPLNRPVLVGVLPLVSLKHANFLNHEVPGISIPDEIIARMEKAGERAAQEGVRIAVELVEQIKPWAQGIYIMPQFSRFDLIADIIDKVKEPQRAA
ncbi:MAG: bifunctional homocysteine S-methyltransferase/methylenetetrahydrofolate reductase [Chloroflexi bacterium]|nr:bifunctional homocysteine S-methyltransferase/methylenetetrahydrofolate reductase [Chloroflexota bacterium]MBI3338628.1 bifunctional homocysteine S-methyltransferase/methylenetetrahydrofolate reductase [Chloroflexota bacterium]